jgi:hypothetical protein
MVSSLLSEMSLRACVVETGEKLFSLETVERLQALVRGSAAPQEYIKSPVFEFV